MCYQTILLNIKDGVAVLTLNQPERSNAVTLQMRLEILRALDDLENDDTIIAVIFTGAGRSFCSGQDVDELKSTEGNIKLKEKAKDSILRLPRRIYGFEKPTIGAINGTAVGDGAQWVLAFDFNVASEKAKFGWIGTALGLV